MARIGEISQHGVSIEGRTTEAIVAWLRTGTHFNCKDDFKCQDCRWRLEAADRLESFGLVWAGIRGYDTSRLEELHGEFGRGWKSCIHHLRQEPPR